MKRFALAAATATLAAVTALPAAAQFRDADAAIKYRQSVMTLQAFHFGRIAGMANGRVPFDAKVVAEDAAVLDVIDKLPFVAFTDGSDKGNTRALPKIWSERAQFDAAAKKFEDDVTKLVAAARTGNIEQVRAAVGPVGGSCKPCHDAYRKD